MAVHLDPRLDSFSQLLDVPAAGVVLEEMATGDNQREWPLDQLEGRHRPNPRIPRQGGAIGQIDPDPDPWKRDARRVPEAVHISLSWARRAH